MTGSLVPTPGPTPGSLTPTPGTTSSPLVPPYFAESAEKVAITDAGNYYSSTNVEGALQEAGASIANQVSKTYLGTGVYAALGQAANGQNGIAVYDGNGNLRVGAGSISVKFGVVSTDAILMPVGTTAQRPTGATGLIRYNSDLVSFEGYNGSTWGSIGGGAVGGGTDHAFYENDATITQSYTITASKNAMTAGPVSINSGATVTVPSGSTWTIV